MGMIGHLRQVTPDELTKMRSNPASVRNLLQGRMPASVEDMKAALQRVQEIGMKAEAKGPVTDPEEIAKVRAKILQELESVGAKVPGDGPDEDVLTRKKSWNPLNYFLPGSGKKPDS